ncbi:MAG TPA: EAL domain-containing protein [Rhodocyclaceae bacterium]
MSPPQDGGGFLPLSKTHLRRIFDAVATPCLILDPDFAIVAANAAYLQATMTRSADIQGRHMFDVFPDNPADSGATGVANLRASLDRVLATGKPDIMPVQRYDIRRPPGQKGSFEQRYWSPVNTPVLDERGKVIYLLHRVIDVTDFMRASGEIAQVGGECEGLRARLEVLEIEMFERSTALKAANLELEEAIERLRDSEQTLRLSHAIGHTATFEWDIAADSLRWSPELAALYGFPAKAFSSSLGTWRKAIHAEDRSAIKEELGKAVRSGHFDAEWRILWPDRSVHWIAGRAIVYSNQSGTPTRMLGVHIDVTEQREVRAELEQSKARLHGVLDSLHEGVLIFDLDGRILDGNPAARDILGYGEAEGACRELPECALAFDLLSLDGQSLPGDAWPIRRVCRGESFTNYEILVRSKKNGRTRVLSHNGAPVRSMGSGIGLGVLTLTDISDLKCARQALEDGACRLALALSASRSAVWEVDVATGRVFSADDLLHGMLGYPPGEPATLDGWLELIHEEDRGRITRLLEDVICGDTDGYRGVELRYRTHGGKWHWILCQAVAARRDVHGRATRLVGTHTDIHARKVADERARTAALHDPLTGLPNRALIFEYGAHMLGAARRDRRGCALLFIDLDRFKPINDLYGHEAGDAVLREVARRLRECTRQEDLVGRLGGDEFVVMLPRIGGVKLVAQHITEVVSRPIRVNAVELSVSPSIGISYYPEQGANMGVLMKRADAAMYKAKQDGPGRCGIFSPRLEKRAEETEMAVASVETAVERGRLMLYYQPIVNLRNGRLVAAEALLRMTTDDGHTKCPYRLSRDIDRSDLGAWLDDWVLVAACRQRNDWMRKGLNRFLVSVNVSTSQITRPAFPEKVRQIVSEIGMDPSLLQVEVSEGIMARGDEATDAFERLRAIGVKIALDGFGAAPFTLGQLSRLAVDRVKMEQTIVRAGAGTSGEQSLSNLVIALGHMLKLEVVGEGIESEDTLRGLQDSGCDEAQGYLLSRPMPADEFARWYQERQIH